MRLRLGTATSAGLAANVRFSIDRSRRERGRAISPDLTRNIKSHQTPSGGPLAKDVSGAEYSDTILYIEGSAIDRGEIWVGTDDGYAQMTRDGGRTTAWHNVTPPGTPQYARIETTAPSPLVAGTAYVVADNHRMGDYAPYIFVTHDYGATWTKIVDGLPRGPIRPHGPPRHSQSRICSMPEPRTGSGFLSTAARTGKIFGSICRRSPCATFAFNRSSTISSSRRTGATRGSSTTSVRCSNSATRNAPARCFIRRATAYEYHYHSNDLGIYTRFAGDNPPKGAIVDFYQGAPQKSPPQLEVLDAQRTRDSHGQGHAQSQRQGRTVDSSNKAGINRYVWDFTEDAPMKWYGAAKEEYQGPMTGATVVPGTYTLRLTLGGADADANRHRKGRSARRLDRGAVRRRI